MYVDILNGLFLLCCAACIWILWDVYRHFTHGTWLLILMLPFCNLIAVRGAVMARNPFATAHSRELLTGSIVLFLIALIVFRQQVIGWVKSIHTKEADEDGDSS